MGTIGRYNSVYLCITNKCNTNCSYCYQKSFDKSKYATDMSEDIAFKAMKFVYTKLDRQPFFKVFLWGGEPFMRWELAKKLVDAYPQIRFHSNTNGEVMTKEMADYLKSNTTYSLVWSVGNAYEKFGGVRQKVEKFPLTADVIRSRSYHGVNLAVTKWDSLYDDYKYLNDNVTKNITLQPIIGIDYDDKDLETFIQQYLKITLEYNVKLDGEHDFNTKPPDNWNFIERSVFWYKKFGPQSKTNKNIFCHCGLNRLLVDTEGGIWGCDGMYVNQMHKFGDIFNGLDQTKLDEMREISANQTKYMRQYCVDCEIKDYCPNTQCMATNHRATGDKFKPYSGFCKLQKAYIRMYKEYVKIRKGEKYVT